MHYYALADLAFVGGSLVPVGGHNVLEPASIGVPVITGPYIHNFKEICELLDKMGALWIIKNTDQLVKQVNLLLANTDLRQNAGEQGRKIVKSNQGSLDKVMYFLQTLLDRNATSGISSI